jgi:hypothetical protein
MNADHRWNEIVNRYGFDLMLLPVNWPLASVVKVSSEWRLIADDGTAILFERRRFGLGADPVATITDRDLRGSPRQSH